MNNKYLLFLMVNIVLLAAGCSSDNNRVSYDEADLIRKWYLPNHNTPGCEKDYIEFTASHEYKGVHYVISPSGCLATDGIGNNYGQSWSLEGDRITLVFQPLGGTSVMKITRLDETGLTLQNLSSGTSTYYTTN